MEVPELLVVKVEEDAEAVVAAAAHAGLERALVRRGHAERLCDVHAVPRDEALARVRLREPLDLGCKRRARGCCCAQRVRVPPACLLHRPHHAAQRLQLLVRPLSVGLLLLRHESVSQSVKTVGDGLAAAFVFLFRRPFLFFNWERNLFD